MARELFRNREVLKDETIVEAKAFSVPESKNYPEGVKYSFQHFDPETGETILRYDNYNEHSGSRHHKHIGEESTEALDFETLEKQFMKFMREVRQNVEDT